MTAPKQPDAESLRLELQEAITSFRHQTLLLSQAYGFLVAADSLLLAYGFSQRKSAILLVASLMPINILVVFIWIMSHAVPFIYVAMKLERKLELREAPLIATYARVQLKHLLSILDRAGELNESEVRFTRRHWLKMRTAVGLIGVFITQLFLFLISLMVFHYRFM